MPYLHDSSETLRDLNQDEKTIVNLTVFGGFFVCFDFMIYYYFDDEIKQAFFPASLSADVQNWGLFLLVMLGYVARPLGGVVLGDLGDRFGRKWVMVASLVMVTLSTLLIGLLPTYEQAGFWAIGAFLLLRLVQGVGFGAEVPTSWVYVAEHMPRWLIGTMCGRLICALIWALLLGNMFSFLLSSMLTVAEMVSYGWRLPFLIGGIGSMVAVILRYRLTESPIWLQAKVKNQLVAKLPLKTALFKYRYGFIVSLVLSWFTSSVYLLVLVLVPRIAVSYFDKAENLMAIANGLCILFAGLGALTFGYFADRFNSGRVLIFGCVALILASGLFFSTLIADSELVLVSYAILGFCSGIMGLIPSICVRLFPVQVRLSGIAFCYNVAQAMTGSLTILGLFYFSNLLSMSAWVYLVFICVVGIIVGLLLTHLHGLYRMEVREIH